MASRPTNIAVYEYMMSPDGTDARHAISVTNLTMAEARQIAVFARALRDGMSQLTGSWKPTPPMPTNEEMAALDYAAYERERQPEPLAARTPVMDDLIRERGRGVSIARTVERMDRANAVLKLNDMMQDAIRDAARQPEPTDADAAGEPPNRFSGLDFE